MSPSKSRPFAIACLVAAAAVLIDQISKAAALTWLSEEERIPLLGDLLGLQLAFNPGAILGLGSGATWLLTLVGVVAVVVLIGAATRARTGWWAGGIGLVLGGAIGNVIDRLLSPPGFGIGHVTDFLAYGTWFIGNFADISLGLGIICLGLISWSRRPRTLAVEANRRVEELSPETEAEVSGR